MYRGDELIAHAHTYLLKQGLRNGSLPSGTDVDRVGLHKRLTSDVGYQTSDGCVKQWWYNGGMKRWVGYLLVVLLGGISAVGFTFRTNPAPQEKREVISEGIATTSAVPLVTETATVARVIDGDTIELADGRRVRYIGVDAPELGDVRKTAACFAKEAMEENKRLVDSKTVRLEKDISDRDRYGRLLRYVYVGEVFVNDYLVRQGVARVATFPPDVAHQEQFLEAQREARQEGRGPWRACTTP